MSLRRARTVVFTFALAAMFAACLTSGVLAADQPLRSGAVISKTDADVYTLIKAVDAAGKEFWVMTSICTIGEKGKIDVMLGPHYAKMQTKQHGILEDVYVGELVKIGDVEVTGFGAHKLPEGCIVMQ